MNKRLHLITTCTRRKAGSVEDTVFPGDASLMTPLTAGTG